MLRSGKLDGAISILERVAAAVPANALSLNALGVAYFQKKKYRDAVQTLKTAVETSPNSGDIRYNLALAHLANRNKEGAISQYRILKTDNPRLAARLYRIIFRDRLVSVEDLNH
jgi:tetratricopeptide (TPR) repeat protein